MALSNARIAFLGAGFAGSMLALTFAAEPLYTAFCEVTGFGGTTRMAVEAPDRIVEHEVAVRFDANVADTPLIFRPLQGPQKVKAGQHGLAFYEVTNPTRHEIRVIATYNVTPHMTGPYFNKLECFCFSERVIGPGETRRLPVVYFVSPDIVEDRIVRNIDTITLSYTFFNSATYTGPRDEVADRGAANPATPG